MIAFTIASIALLLDGTFPHRLKPITKAKARDQILTWANKTPHSRSYYYAQSVGGLYMRDEPLILALHQFEKPESPIEAIMMIDSNGKVFPVLWVLCSPPDKHEVGVTLLKALYTATRPSPVTFSATVSPMWVAEYMWFLE